MSLHQNTPTLTVSDPRGLVVRTVSWHRSATQDTVQARNTLQRYDAIGRLNQQWDPRLCELSDLANQSTRYSLSGQALLTTSVDAGWRLACHDAAGQLRDSWDGRDTHRRFTYDELMRPVNVFEHEPPLCVERFTYAGADEEDAHHNRCGQLLRHDDQAGSLWHDAFALTGQPLSETRQFCTVLSSPHWPASEADLEDTAYTTRWCHDALGTVIEQIDALEHVQRFEFDVAGQPFASWLDDVALLKSTTYNAFGQVEIEQSGNDVTTTAFYSARDGLLSNLKAKRSDGKTLQDLHYQYDPVGNITRIEDLAQPVQWFAGQRIQAVSTFTYDTLYQLISATGRENASQTIGPSLPGLEIFGPVDDSRWRTYSQTYSYDSGGNLTRLKHAAGAANSYTREMVVDARSNRSLFKGGSPLDFAKAFDANGNQQALAPGQLMQWDSRNQLQLVTQVQREDPDGQDDDTETYVYDGGGQRVRKVRRAKTRGGEHISEVRYLPGLEIRSRTTGEQLHVVLAQAGRNAVRLLNRENGHHQHRYSVNDHLGSSTLELGQNGELLSQESYYPYGGTAWWAAKSALEARYKVIRYSGKERDATGLYYYGFRYYAPWLQRWINPDPMGEVDGLNVFRFVLNSPLSWMDSAGAISLPVNDAIEQGVRLKRTSIAFVARGLQEFEALGETGSELAGKLRDAQTMAVDILSSAIESVSSPQRSKVAHAAMSFFLGGTAVSGRTQTELREGFEKLKSMQLSRIEKGKDRIVIYEEDSKTDAFVVKVDTERRIFIKQSTIQTSDITSLARQLIHEESHLELGTYDAFYMPVKNFGYPDSDEALFDTLKTAMAISRDVGSKGENSKAVRNVEKYREVMAKMPTPVAGSCTETAANHWVFLNNADSWAHLAIGMAKPSVISKYGPKK